MLYRGYIGWDNGNKTETTIFSVSGLGFRVSLDNKLSFYSGHLNLSKEFRSYSFLVNESKPTLNQ